MSGRINRKWQRGFSLIEVNLAIFVVAVGLLTLFSLFPAGLKEGEAGHADTQTSLFADYVLSTIRANAMRVKSGVWKSPFDDLLDGLPSSIGDGGGSPAAVEFPAGSGLYVRYYLDFVATGKGLWGVKLWVASGQYGTKNLDKFRHSAYMYYTEVFFSGMP